MRDAPAALPSRVLLVRLSAVGDVINVLHGFEGELDEHFQRGRLNGWRCDGLPWEQL